MAKEPKTLDDLFWCVIGAAMLLFSAAS